MSTVPPMPRELALLREHGVISSEPLDDAITRDILEYVEELIRNDEPDGVLGVVLYRVALQGPGFGPNGWAVCYSDVDELAELGGDVTSALGSASRVRVETKWDHGIGGMKLALVVDGQRTVQQLRDRSGGAISNPISGALARVGDPRQLIEVECDWESFLYLLAPRATIVALVDAGVTGLLTAPKPRRR